MLNPAQKNDLLGFKFEKIPFDRIKKKKKNATQHFKCCKVTKTVRQFSSNKPYVQFRYYENCVTLENIFLISLNNFSAENLL